MIKRFLSFTINPTYFIRDECNNIFCHIKRVLSGILLYFLIIIATTPLFVALKNFNLMPEHINSVRDENLSIVFLFLIPFIEEVAFRLPLRYTRFNLSLSFSFICFIIFRIFLNIPKNISIILIVPIFVILCFIVLRNNLVEERIEEFWKKNFKWFFYFSAIFFGLLHITNYVNLNYIYYILTPIITMNHILMGFVLGYYRVNFKYGFFYSIVIHLIINTPFYILKVSF